MKPICEKVAELLGMELVVELRGNLKVKIATH